MLKSKKMLEETANACYDLYSSIEYILARLKRDDVDFSMLEDSVKIMHKVRDNMIKQIDVLVESEAYQKEYEDSYGKKYKKKK